MGDSVLQCRIVEMLGDLRCQDELDDTELAGGGRETVMRSGWLWPKRQEIRSIGNSRLLPPLCLPIPVTTAWFLTPSTCDCAYTLRSYELVRAGIVDYSPEEPLLLTAWYIQALSIYLRINSTLLSPACSHSG